jgi:hypothetical protein
VEGTYHCNYGWAFVENTEYGRNTLAVLDIEREKLRHQQNIISKLYNRFTKERGFRSIIKSIKLDSLLN